MKSIALIGSVGIPSKYGGFETLAENLFHQLKNRYHMWISYESRSYRTDELPTHENLHLVAIRFRANGAMSIIHDITALLTLRKKTDVIVLMGISSGLFLPILKKIFKLPPIIVHVDGLEWKRLRWSGPAKWFLYISYRSVLRYGDGIIADNNAIYENVKNICKIPVAQIAYGGTCNKHLVALNDETRPNHPYFLTIARAVPENSLDQIAECFTQLPCRYWVLISNFDQTKFGRNIRKMYQSYPNILFVNAAYEPSTLSWYRSNCIAYIHGHQAGGTNPSLVEMLWYQKPVICHDNIFNRNTSFNEATYYTTIESLQTLIEEETFLQQNIAKINKLASELYTWEKVANAYSSMINTYIKQDSSIVQK